MLVVTTAYATLTDVTSLGGYMFDLPSLGDASIWFAAPVMAALLYLHPRHASSRSVRRAAVLAGVLPVMMVAGVQWMGSRNSAQNVNQVDAQMRIYPPGLRMTPAGKLDDYFKRVANLRAEADQKRDALPPNDNGE